MTAARGHLPGPLIAGWTLAVGLGLVVLGCGANRGLDEERPADATYTIRGVLRTAPAGHEVTIRHQAIQEFRNRDGEVVGMDSMAMPFSLASTVSREGLEAGDPVELTFDVRWEGDPVLLVRELRELPAGTEVSFVPGSAVAEAAAEPPAPPVDGSQPGLEAATGPDGEASPEPTP